MIFNVQLLGFLPKQETLLSNYCSVVSCKLHSKCSVRQPNRIREENEWNQIYFEVFFEFGCDGHVERQIESSGHDPLRAVSQSHHSVSHPADDQLFIRELQMPPAKPSQ